MKIAKYICVHTCIYTYICMYVYMCTYQLFIFHVILPKGKENDYRIF